MTPSRMNVAMFWLERFRIVRRQKRGDPDAETGLIQIQFQVAQFIVPHLPGEGC